MRRVSGSFVSIVLQAALPMPWSAKGEKNCEKLDGSSEFAPMKFYHTQAEITAPPRNRNYLPILGERSASWGLRRSKNATNQRNFDCGISRVFCILVSDNRDVYIKAFITRRSHIRWTNLPWVLGIAGRRTGWSICGSRRGHFSTILLLRKTKFSIFLTNSLWFFFQKKRGNLTLFWKKPVRRFLK